MLVCAFLRYLAHETAGNVPRHSLRPLFEEGKRIHKGSGRHVARMPSLVIARLDWATQYSRDATIERKPRLLIPRTLRYDHQGYNASPFSSRGIRPTAPRPHQVLQRRRAVDQAGPISRTVAAISTRWRTEDSAGGGKPHRHGVKTAPAQRSSASACPRSMPKARHRRRLRRALRHLEAHIEALPRDRMGGMRGVAD